MENLDLQQLRQGNPSQWRAFVDLAAPIVLATVRRVFAAYGRKASAEEQEDVSQDVFVKLSRNNFELLKRYDPAKAKLTTFVGVISRSTSIDHLRKVRAMTANIDDFADTLASDESALDGGGNPALSRQHQSTAGVFTRLPASLLSDKQRHILELLFDHDLDPEDIAPRLGISIQTVRSAKHKAMTKIRNFISTQTDKERFA